MSAADVTKLDPVLARDDTVAVTGSHLLFSIRIDFDSYLDWVSGISDGFHFFEMSDVIPMSIGTLPVQLIPLEELVVRQNLCGSLRDLVVFSILFESPRRWKIGQEVAGHLVERKVCVERCYSSADA